MPGKQLAQRYNEITEKLRTTSRELVSLVRGYVQLKSAEIAKKLYSASDHAKIQIARRKAVVTLVALETAVAISALVAPLIQFKIEPFFAVKDNLSSLRSLFLNVGSASIGAAAIAFSLVLFAIQVNVERMPHGLFRRLSSDKKLLGAFFGSFALAVLVCLLSMIPTESIAAAALIAMGWGLLSMLGLFLYAYRRALILINPIEQLKIVQIEVIKDLNFWLKRSKRIRPLLDDQGADQPEAEERHDLAQIEFFKLHPGWARRAFEGVKIAVSYSRQYAQNGDYDVADVATAVIVQINSMYVAAKGRTFFTHNGLFDDPRATDAFVNSTLEQVKQSFQAALSRRDEQQLEQALKTYAALSGVYQTINYPGLSVSKHHANLANGYLSNAVEEVAGHNLPDVMMIGARLMGVVTLQMLRIVPASEATTLIERIGVVACTGALNEKHRPVTQAAMGQLGSIVFVIMQVDVGDDDRFAIEKAVVAAASAAKLYVAKQKDTQTHAGYLAPYYSTIENNSLLPRIWSLVDFIIRAPAGIDRAEKSCKRIFQWAKEQRLQHKDLLLLSIDRGSPLTFDLLQWTKSIMEILLTLANANACPDHLRAQLRSEACNMLSVLTWLPMDRKVINILAAHSFTELLFRAAAVAQAKGGNDAYLSAKAQLLNWGVEGQASDRGWAILEHSIYALTTLSVQSGIAAETQWLSQALAAKRPRIELLRAEVRQRVAQQIHENADALHPRPYEVNDIMRALARVDRASAQQLLHTLADLIA